MYTGGGGAGAATYMGGGGGAAKMGGGGLPTGTKWPPMGGPSRGWTGGGGGPWRLMLGLLATSWYQGGLNILAVGRVVL